MASVFGIGEIIKNIKIKREVKKIDKDIKEFSKEFIPIRYNLLYPINLNKAINLVKGFLKDIDQYKKSLKLYDPHLHNFSEFIQLESSIKNFLTLLEKANKLMHTSHNPTELNAVIQKIKIESHNIQNFWNEHKNKLHRLGIIK